MKLLKVACTAVSFCLNGPKQDSMTFREHFFLGKTCVDGRGVRLTSLDASFMRCFGFQFVSNIVKNIEADFFLQNIA